MRTQFTGQCPFLRTIKYDVKKNHEGQVNDYYKLDLSKQIS